MNIAYKKNKLLQMRGFCFVMEKGSILEASKAMNTAHSNVSLQVSTLERDLEVTLFTRKGNKLIPTEEAERLYKICKKTLDEVDFIFQNLRSAIKHDNDNIIKISAHSYMFSHILPPYFKQMVEENPKVQFELFNSSYNEAIDMVNAGSVDFAVFPADVNNLPKGIEVKEFYKCQFGIVVSKNHPFAAVNEKDITWDLLAKYDFITLGEGITAQKFKTHLELNGINSRFKLHNGSWEICIGMIRQGITISGADAFYAKNHKGVIVKNCHHLMPSYKFHIIRNKKNKISKSSNILLDLMDTYFVPN
jgi:DNA-binding transcriptional LysR family regulator